MRHGFLRSAQIWKDTTANAPLSLPPAFPPTQNNRAIAALICDWQFLESLGMGPIQLVGEDEEEEEEAKAKARATATEVKEGG